MESFTGTVSGIRGKAHDMFTVNGIPFNHESTQRGETSVTCNNTGAVEHRAVFDTEKDGPAGVDVVRGRAKGLNTGLFNISNVRIKVNISRYL